MDLASGGHPFLSFDVMLALPSPPQRYWLGDLRDFLRALKQAGHVCEGEARASIAGLACGEGDAQTLIEFAVEPVSVSPNSLRIESITSKGKKIPVDEFPGFLSAFLNP
ncbi:hypothetical protein [Microvirga sp. TS319]|uniref:hypothetical protein n=1 Tax=Microvirga sp. TS319 TaxID=3241165 RepID=UPI00351AA5D0